MIMIKVSELSFFLFCRDTRNLTANNPRGKVAIGCVMRTVGPHRISPALRHGETHLSPTPSRSNPSPPTRKIRLSTD